MKNLLCLAALLVSAATLTAGPIREAIRDFRENRPGLIIPKRSGCGSAAPRSSCAGACASCPSCDQCPGGTCPLPVSSAPSAAPKVVRYVQVCENGKCRLVPVRE